MSRGLKDCELNEAIRDMYEIYRYHFFGSGDDLTVQQKLNVANSKLASIELILLDYYNDEIDKIDDLADAIRFVLDGGNND